MLAFLQKFFLPINMVPKEKLLGEVPSTKVAYNKAIFLAWPALVENFLGSLINIVDTLMVAGIGYHAIAAVGIVNQPRFLVQNLIFSLTSAVSIICSHRKGANNRQDAINTLKQGMVLCLIVSILMSIIFIPTSRQLIAFMGAKPDTLDMANDYFRVLLYGIPLYNFTLLISAAQRGVGNTKISMVINVTASVIDLVFSYVLIHGVWIFPNLGVTGGAVANILGWVVSFLIAMYSISKPEFYLYIGYDKKWRLTAKTLKSIWNVGIGTLFEGLCIRIGFIASSKIIAELGTAKLAAHEILSSLMNVSFSFGSGYSNAAATLVGQNIGKIRPDLSAIYCKICQRISMFTSCLLFIVFSIWGTNFVGAFTDSPEVIDLAQPLILVMSIVIFAQATQLVFAGGLQGAGDTKFTAIMYMVSIMLVRPLASYFFAYTLKLGLNGVWIGIVLDQLLRFVLSKYRFDSGVWMKIAV